MSSGQQGGGESTPVTKRRGSSDDYEGVEMDETGDSKASSTNGKGGVPRRDSSEHVELTLSPRLGDDYVDGDEWETGPDELGEFHHRDGAGNGKEQLNKGAPVHQCNTIIRCSIAMPTASLISSIHQCQMACQPLGHATYSHTHSHAHAHTRAHAHAHAHAHTTTSARPAEQQ